MMHPAKAGFPKQKTSACLPQMIPSHLIAPSSYLLARNKIYSLSFDLTIPYLPIERNRSPQTWIQSECSMPKVVEEHKFIVPSQMEVGVTRPTPGHKSYPSKRANPEAKPAFNLGLIVEASNLQPVCGIGCENIPRPLHYLPTATSNTAVPAVYDPIVVRNN
ncbi:uncharacterized protein LOC121896996 [Thunnus maccoyii]|uniref:uncharacterized protein LOC121896996 n=1 Tax=Thunnus maccoyii TaxID=8240 RepID=UPI001C4A8B06|nr:uncharacterized protein LOC121896996 [Thunnus maccoyii]